MPSHKFGMKIRFIVLLAANNHQFIAYYTWKHSVSVDEFIGIHLEREPITFILVSGKKIAFKNHENGDLHQDLDNGSYDLMLEVDEEMAKNEKLNNAKILELMSDDPLWTVEQFENPQKLKGFFNSCLRCFEQLQELIQKIV